jgi:hypothetical protein
MVPPHGPGQNGSSLTLSVGLLAAICGSRGSWLEVFPKHFLLHPGEQIHYTVCSEDSKPRCPDAEFAMTDPKVVRLVDPKGILEAVRPALNS